MCSSDLLELGDEGHDRAGGDEDEDGEREEGNAAPEAPRHLGHPELLARLEGTAAAVERIKWTVSAGHSLDGSLDGPCADAR